MAPRNPCVDDKVAPHRLSYGSAPPWWEPSRKANVLGLSEKQLVIAELAALATVQVIIAIRSTIEKKEWLCPYQTHRRPRTSGTARPT